MMLALYIIVALVVIVFILAAIAPKSYDVFRTTEIARSKAELFDYLKYIKNQEIWSPWAKKDPDMARKYTGTDGEVGFVSYWNGNKEVGEGEQEITAVIENERVDGELRFLKPFRSTSNCYFILEEVSPNKTKVSWGFSGKNVFPMTLFMLFMNMDKAVGKDFEEGLAELKKIVEK